MEYDLEAHGVTDPGRRRSANEDHFLVAELARHLRVRQSSLIGPGDTLSGEARGFVLAVADGIGGHSAGERASAIAVNALTHYVLNCQGWFFRVNERPDEDFIDDLKDAIKAADDAIHAEQAPGTGRQMGTTLTLAYIVWPRLYLVHVGDSRCYLWRAGCLKQLTRDHTLAQALADDGTPVPSAAEHVLLNALGGTDDAARPDVSKALLRDGDVVMLCTDGLTRDVSDRQIASVLCDTSSLASACGALVDAANEAGGADNVTVVLARVTATGTETDQVFPSGISAEDDTRSAPAATARWGEALIGSPRQRPAGDPPPPHAPS